MSHALYVIMLNVIRPDIMVSGVKLIALPYAPAHYVKCN